MGIVRSAAGLGLAAALAAGCATSGGVREAVLPQSTADERLALNAAMRDMTGVPLRATTRSFRDRAVEELSWGAEGTGMDTAMPGDFRVFTFRLLDAGGVCQLEHVESGERRSVPDVSCRAL